MSPRPLSLSNYQLALVQDAAKAIPPDWRSRFLEAVADRLLPLDVVITDNAVAEAVTVRPRTDACRRDRTAMHGRSCAMSKKRKPPIPPKSDNQLSFTDAQCRLIHEASLRVPYATRLSFLNLVVDLLEGQGGEPDDARIVEAVKHVLAQIHVQATEPQCCGGR